MYPVMLLISQSLYDIHHLHQPPTPILTSGCQRPPPQLNNCHFFRVSIRVVFTCVLFCQYNKANTSMSMRANTHTYAHAHSYRCMPRAFTYVCMCLSQKALIRHFRFTFILYKSIIYFFAVFVIAMIHIFLWDCVHFLKNLVLSPLCLQLLKAFARLAGRQTVRQPDWQPCQTAWLRAPLV